MGLGVLDIVRVINNKVHRLEDILVRQTIIRSNSSPAPTEANRVVCSGS